MKKEDSLFSQVFKGVPKPQQFKHVEEERLHRKQRLAAGFRLFAKYNFDEGFAGHITVRDPEYPNTFWVNPMGVHFNQICVSNLVRIDHKGNVIEGNHAVNTAALIIHAKLHEVRSDVLAAAHAHSFYGKSGSVFGRRLDPITQDSCAFYEDHGVFQDYGGAAVTSQEGEKIAKALGQYKAIILQNHGLLTVGKTIDEAVWWYICFEHACQVQLQVCSACDSSQDIKMLSPQIAKQVYQLLGSSDAGWFEFQPLYENIVKEQPDLLL